MKQNVLVACMLLCSATASAQVQKWEYARLSIVGRYPGPVGSGPTRVSSTLYIWEKGQDTSLYEYKDGGYEKFFTDILGKLPKSLQETSLMNDLGSVGWELAGTSFYVESYLNNGSQFYNKNDVYWLKRPIK